MLDLLTRRGAILVLALLALVCAACWLASPPPPRAGTMKITDTELYTRVVDRLRHGKAYYPTVAALQREGGAPLKPFVTVRLPTLARVQAALAPGWIKPLAQTLLALNALAFVLVLRRSGANLAEQLLCGAFTGAAGMIAFAGGLLVWHEIWAGLLLGLALAARADGRRWLALGFAVTAIAVRELALPFALLALAFALVERHWREAAAWSAVIGGFVVLLLVHRALVEAQLRPGDLASPGWNGWRGPVAIVDSLHDVTLLGALPRPLSYVLAVLPMLGWLALPARRGAFPVLFFLGYGLLISLFARPDNFYWVEVVLPAWFAGLALAPRGFAMLVRRAWGPCTGPELRAVFAP